MNSKIQKKLDTYINAFKDCFNFKIGINNPIILNLNDATINSCDWSSWSKKFGIYVIYKETKIFYIGRALKDKSFGERIASHMEKKEIEWMSVFKDNNSWLILYPFDEQDDYWSASLEIFLYDKFEPTLNIKRG